MDGVTTLTRQLMGHLRPDQVLELVKQRVGIPEVLMYDETFAGGVINLPLSECTDEMLGGKVNVNFEAGEWTFEPVPGRVELYNLGRSMRVPETDGMWGPAFVFLPNDPAHVEEANRVLERIRTGDVTR